MKTLFVLISLLSSVHAMAAFTAKVDCSKAEAGEVTMTDTAKTIDDERYTAKEAAMKAYSCFVERKNKTVKETRTQAIKESLKNAQSSKPVERCGFSLGPFDLEYSTLSSMKSGSYIFNNDVGTMKSEFVLAVRENFICSYTDDDLSSGVTSSAVIKVKVTETNTSDFATKKATQVFNVQVLEN